MLALCYMFTAAKWLTKVRSGNPLLDLTKKLNQMELKRSTKHLALECFFHSKYDTH